jgi:hypothetical protein
MTHDGAFFNLKGDTAVSPKYASRMMRLSGVFCAKYSLRETPRIPLLLPLILGLIETASKAGAAEDAGACASEKGMKIAKQSVTRQGRNIVRDTRRMSYGEESSRVRMKEQSAPGDKPASGSLSDLERLIQ